MLGEAQHAKHRKAEMPDWLSVLSWLFLSPWGPRMWDHYRADGCRRARARGSRIKRWFAALSEVRSLLAAKTTWPDASLTPQQRGRDATAIADNLLRDCEEGRSAWALSALSTMSWLRTGYTQGFVYAPAPAPAAYPCAATWALAPVTTGQGLCFTGDTPGSVDTQGFVYAPAPVPRVYTSAFPAAWALAPATTNGLYLTHCTGGMPGPAYTPAPATSAYHAAAWALPIATPSQDMYLTPRTGHMPGPVYVPVPAAPAYDAAAWALVSAPQGTLSGSATFCCAFCAECLVGLV